MSNQPIARLSYYDKNEKRSYDVAALFRNDRHDWKTDVAPEKRADYEAQYPKMLLSEAAARAERGEGYLSIAKPKAKQGAQQPRQGQQRTQGGYDRPTPRSGAQRDYGGGGGASDDETPFRRFDDRTA